MSRNENSFQLFGWPMYIIRNAAGQMRYPSSSNRSYNDRLLMVISVMTPHSRLQPQCRDVRTPSVWSGHHFRCWHPFMAWRSCRLDIPIWIFTSVPPVSCTLSLVNHSHDFRPSHLLNMFTQGEPLVGPHHLLAAYRPAVAALSFRGVHIPSWCSVNA
jgi:hypothetical protein